MLKDLQMTRFTHFNEPDQICSDNDIRLIVKKAAEDLEDIVLDSPLKVKILTYLPQIFIKNALTIHKLHDYLCQFQNDILNRGEQMKELLNVYWRKIGIDKIYPDQEEKLFDDIQFFKNLCSMNISPQIANEFIQFQLVISSYGVGIFSNLPQYILTFWQLDFEVFYKCITNFIKLPQNYEFSPEVLSKISVMIEETIQRFLDTFQGQQNDNQVCKMKKLVVEIISNLYIYLDNYRNQNPSNIFTEGVLNKLLVKETFCCTIFALMKKFNFLTLFKDWVQVMINLGGYNTSIRLVQFVIFYFTNIVCQLGIDDLIDANYEWTLTWVNRLFGNKFQMICSMFLNGEPYYMVIFVKLLHFYKFEGENDFKQKMELIQFPEAVKKVIHDEKAKESVVRLYKFYFENWEQQVNAIFMQELQHEFN